MGLCNGIFQVALHGTGIGLPLFGHRLQDASVNLIGVYSRYRVNICNLEWVNFIMINNKLSLLVAFHRSKGVLRYQNNEIGLVDRQIGKRQLLTVFYILVGDGWNRAGK